MRETSVVKYIININLPNFIDKYGKTNDLSSNIKYIIIDDTFTHVREQFIDYSY